MKKTIFLAAFVLILNMFIPVYGFEISAVTTETVISETVLLNLEDIIRIAKENSFDTETSRMKAYKAELDKTDEKNNYNNHNSFFSSGLSVQTQVTRIMTGKGYYYELASIALENARKDIEITLDNIEIQALNMYFDAIFAKENMLLREKALSLAVSKYNGIKLKYELGKVSGMDFKTAESNYLDADINLDNAKSDYKYALQKLCVFLGYEYDKNVDVTGELTYGKFSSDLNFTEMYNNALNNNSLYQSAFYNFEKTRLFNSLVEGVMATTSVGKRGLADFIIAKNTMQNAKNNVLLSVLGEMVNIQKLENSIHVFNRQIELNKDKVKLKETEYSLGRATLTDVFDAESILQQSELNLLTGKKNYSLAVRRFENIIKK